MSPIVIASRFRGPEGSANGGYFAGCVAVHAGRTVTVRLLRPSPLDTPLDAVELADGTLAIRSGTESIGEAKSATLELLARSAPGYFEAVEASRRYAGFKHHRFPTCFVCGTQRSRGDGMRVFAGPVAEGGGLVAAPWVPDASLAQGAGKVRPEFMSAALDCPGYYAVSPDDRMMLLGEITVHVNRLVHVGERCTVTGWALEASGRKRAAGTAIFDEDGEVCALARALWIELKGTPQAF
ncbi:MAG: PaaI family thioesterase [Steroidobacteraceae bacterium]